MVLVVMGVVEPGGVDRHRTVEIDRYPWDFFALTQPGDMQHECLGATDGERRDDDHATTGGHPADDRRELGLLVDRDMGPVAVGRFADQHVTGGQGRRRIHKRLLLPSQIATEVQALALDVQTDVGGAQDMAGGMEAHREAGRDLDVAPVVTPLELLQAAAGVVFRVERSRLLVLRIALARCVHRLFFEKMPAVWKQQATQGDAAMGAVDPAPKSLFDQCGEVARMIQMGVGQDHRVDR